MANYIESGIEEAFHNWRKPRTEADKKTQEFIDRNDALTAAFMTLTGAETVPVEGTNSDTQAA